MTPEELARTLADDTPGTPGHCAWCEEDRPETWVGKTAHGQYKWSSDRIVGDIPLSDQPEVRLCADCWQEDSESM